MIAPSILWAYDPGVNTGWAYFLHGELYYCGVLGWRGFVPEDVLRLQLASHCDVLVVEKPQVYRAGQQKGDQEDIIDTAVRAGIIVGKAVSVGELWTPMPREWKGQTPKPIHNRRVLETLTETERVRVPKLTKEKLHNCLDACGLGLVKLGRMT